MKSADLKRPGKRQTIKTAINDWIAEQGLAPGDMIMGQNELARHFGVTQVTIFKALRELVEEGVVYRVNGKGTFVGASPYVATRKALCFVLPGVGLDQPEHNPHYWPEVQTFLRCFVGAMSDRWSFSVHPVQPDSDVRRAAAELAGCDAVFFTHTKEPQALLDYMIRHKVAPVVAFGQPQKQFPCLTLDYDRAEATRQGISHLAELGHKQIAFVASREYWGDLALEGYRRALAEFGLPVEAARIVRIGEHQQDGYRGISQLLNKKIPFDAVFCDGDLRALGVLECLRQAGVRVPHDVGVMGFDGFDYACRLPPFLTTVEIPRLDMIRSALTRVEQAPGKPTPSEYLEFRCRVLPGHTTSRRPAPAC